MMEREMTNGEIVIKGGVGTGASLGAWMISTASQFNPVLQMISLVIGIAIGVVSLVKLTKKRK